MGLGEASPVVFAEMASIDHMAAATQVVHWEELGRGDEQTAVFPEQQPVAVAGVALDS